LFSQPKRLLILSSHGTGFLNILTGAISAICHPFPPEAPHPIRHGTTASPWPTRPQLAQRLCRLQLYAQHGHRPPQEGHPQARLFPPPPP
ncbi:hypothetical protein PTTG_10467, partial [Puccinia triticina 1-1 BBBD Race 1]